jgi:DNA polymerase III delta prime subunit
MLDIHKEIKLKLNYFYETHRVPNIIFHGPSGSGKKTIVFDFINIIYSKIKEKQKDYIYIVNCSQGKGIKFIREDLKFFAKTHINSNCGDIFKSIILLNADKLTIDAQSALRRCIEIFCHNTRFFIIVENKQKLLKPIISRFCEIYVPQPSYNNKIIDLYKYNSYGNNELEILENKKIETLKKTLNILKNKKNINYNEVINITIKLYEKGYSGIDLIHILDNTNNFNDITPVEKYNFLIMFSVIKKEIRNEKLIILFILNFIFLNKKQTQENFLLFY